MNTNKGIVATYEDATGTTRTIHGTRFGLQLKRERLTPALALNQVAGRLVGLRIRAERQRQGMSMADLAIKAGLGTATPKQRIHEIEVGSRKEGVRLGTLYALAEALGVEPSALLPTRDELLKEAQVTSVSVPTLVTERAV